MGSDVYDDDGSDVDFDFGETGSIRRVHPTAPPEMPSRGPRLAEAAHNDRKPLKVLTAVHEQAPYSAISMMPTPITGNASNSVCKSASQMPALSSDQSRPVSVRNLSASVVPDLMSLLQSPVELPTSNLHTNLVGTHPKLLLASEKQVQLGRADSYLVVPKRHERAAAKVNLGRSVSVGAPQRQPTTALHREPKVESILETLPAEVYLATNQNGEHTAWSRIKLAGKGSFSEVVLARPAQEFVRPELSDWVEQEVEEELKQLERERNGGRDVVVNGGDAPAAPPGKPNRGSILVAVKITALNHAKADSELQFFKRDLEIMSKLPRHPSIMRLIGSSLDEDVHKRALFILPYCPGGDLFDLVARHRAKLTAMMIRRLFADLTSAVAFLHDNLIVHRDIKLENVLLDVSVSQLLAMEHPDQYPGPLAVLTDLGLARSIDAENPVLTTRCGSDDYVPPEIMLGQAYDGRETDSWALGVLLYAMMEGRLPFDAPPHMAQYEGNRARLRTAHRIARVDWAWYKRSDAGPEWAGGKEVVEGCLQRRSKRRLAKDTLALPWVAEAHVPIIFNEEDDEISLLFVQ